MAGAVQPTYSAVDDVLPTAGNPVAAANGGAPAVPGGTGASAAWGSGQETPATNGGPATTATPAPAVTPGEVTSTTPIFTTPVAAAPAATPATIRLGGITDGFDPFANYAVETNEGVRNGGPTTNVVRLGGNSDGFDPFAILATSSSTPDVVRNGGPTSDIVHIGGSNGMDFDQLSADPLGTGTEGGGSVGGCGMAGCTMPNCTGGSHCSTADMAAAGASTAAAANGGGAQTGTAAESAAPAAPRKKTTYIVKKGDTIASIAKRFSITEKALKDANKDALNQAKPFPGQPLIIPAGAVPKPAAVAEKPASLDSLAKYPLAGSTEKNRIEFLTWAARQYGVSGPLLVEMAKLESDFVVNAHNKTDINAQNGTPSKGMMQFIEKTFFEFAPKAKVANADSWKGLGALSWLDWRQQALTAAWAVKNGFASHWATYEAAKRTTGA